jgi:hypothetical protein
MTGKGDGTIPDANSSVIPSSFISEVSVPDFGSAEWILVGKASTN